MERGRGREDRGVKENRWKGRGVKEKTREEERLERKGKKRWNGGIRGENKHREKRRSEKGGG